MPSSINVTELLNPYTPMAFLPPDLAFQEQTSSYVLVGAAGAMVWDILTNINSDYKLLFKQRIGLPTIVYFISRIAALFYVLISTIFDSAPVGRCSIYQGAINVSYPITVPATSLLFFFRIRAIFTGNNYIISFFFALWLAVLGGSLTLLKGVRASTIGPTQYCINSVIEPYVGATVIMPLVHDTLVFLAISWCLVSNSHINYNATSRWKALSGHYLPNFSKSLLRDGQLYYLITVGGNLLTTIMVFVPSVSVPYRTMFTVPNVMLTNAMACHVFRSTKIDLIRGSAYREDSNRSTLPLAFRGPTLHSNVVDPTHTLDFALTDVQAKTTGRIMPTDSASTSKALSPI
ncbi:hypothetical protein SERLA73DRAFT_167446 [Serpula lacrymans var. lacrymans S7.3]|uniref:Uncharacterized protein n=2 Tax=Serpula lacrymans var. lacrymans TaxID=341189 RepID=F8PSS2_SERL3|nr:uncharacterized protein SERLADRAFT_448100 [Serpula lacrymans var. lacrymans S7.9]EGO01350.1 hypothetical protein SERLA73DRAFT_167446 [Serpula lacrymans var. lacrymans S7.3]EGO26990.1 hypothetical protein SERLADRAFT_448100 [Serpula lacrymans var. lacrymans S7.9]